MAAIAAQVAGAGLTMAAAVGGVVALGNVGLELGRIYIDRTKEQLDRPLRYLTELKDKFA